jgi:hypothetical protein
MISFTFLLNTFHCWAVQEEQPHAKIVYVHTDMVDVGREWAERVGVLVYFPLKCWLTICSTMQIPVAVQSKA